MRVQVVEDGALFLKMKEGVIRSSYMIPFVVLVLVGVLSAMGGDKALPTGIVLCLAIMLLPFIVLLLYYGCGKGGGLFDVVRL